MGEPVSASNIPTIAVLKEKLKYGDISLPRAKDFSRDVKSYAVYFIVKKVNCADMATWRSPEHQLMLRQLTKHWLERRETGLKYWPADPRHPNFNGLHYIDHSSLIEGLMMQLFFKTSSNLIQNRRYKTRHTPTPGPAPRRTSDAPCGPASGAEPVDLDHHQTGQTSPQVDSQPRKSLQARDDQPKDSSIGHDGPTRANDAHVVATNQGQDRSTVESKIAFLRGPLRKRMHQVIDPDNTSHDNEETAAEELGLELNEHTAKKPRRSPAARPESRGMRSASRTRNVPARRPSFNYYDVSEDVLAALETPSPVPSDCENNNDDDDDDDNDNGENKPDTAEDANAAAAIPDLQEPEEAPSTSTKPSMAPNTYGSWSGTMETPFRAPVPIMWSTLRGTEASASTQSTLHKRHTLRERGSKELSAEAAVVPTIERITDICSADGKILAPLRRVEWQNKWTKEILSLPILRSVEIRRGRRFSADAIDSIYEKTDHKGIKWLACMIQATGTVQSLRCSSCEKNQGAFARCIVVGGSLFPKCGNCEWNRQGCHVLGRRQAASRAQEPIHSSTEATSGTEAVPATEGPQRDTLSQMEKDGVSDPGDQPRLETGSSLTRGSTSMSTRKHTTQTSDVLAGDDRTPGVDSVEIESTISTHGMGQLNDDAPEVPLRGQNEPRLEEAQGTVPTPSSLKKPTVTIVYNIILSRQPRYREVPWTPQGSFRRKSLSEFASEVPLKLSPDAKGYFFTLTGPDLHVQRTIERGKDGAFELWKDKIGAKVHKTMSQTARSSSDVNFELSVEEWREDTALVDEPQEERFVNF